MKFEKLSESRIKITVSGDDLDLWGITATGLVQNTPEAQEVFWYIIRKAETETGFSPGQAKLLVEALPGKGPGIILFMTVLAEESDFSEALRLRSGKRLRVKTSQEPRAFIYEFEGFEDLCDSLPRFSESVPSSLYRLNGKYYLSLKAPERGEEHMIASEYGNRLDGTPYVTAYLKEHGTLLLEEGAIRQLKEYF